MGLRWVNRLSIRNSKHKIRYIWIYVFVSNFENPISLGEPTINYYGVQTDSHFTKVYHYYDDSVTVCVHLNTATNFKWLQNFQRQSIYASIRNQMLLRNDISERILWRRNRVEFHYYWFPQFHRDWHPSLFFGLTFRLSM